MVKIRDQVMISKDKEQQSFGTNAKPSASWVWEWFYFSGITAMLSRTCNIMNDEEEPEATLENPELGRKYDQVYDIVKKSENRKSLESKIKRGRANPDIPENEPILMSFVRRQTNQIPRDPKKYKWDKKRPWSFTMWSHSRKSPKAHVHEIILTPDKCIIPESTVVAKYQKSLSKTRDEIQKADDSLLDPSKSLYISSFLYAFDEVYVLNGNEQERERYLRGSDEVKKQMMKSRISHLRQMKQLELESSGSSAQYAWPFDIPTNLRFQVHHNTPDMEENEKMYTDDARIQYDHVKDEYIFEFGAEIRILEGRSNASDYPCGCFFP